MQHILAQNVMNIHTYSKMEVDSVNSRPAVNTKQATTGQKIAQVSLNISSQVQ